MFRPAVSLVAAGNQFLCSSRKGRLSATLVDAPDKAPSSNGTRCLIQTFDAEGGHGHRLSVAGEWLDFAGREWNCDAGEVLERLSILGRFLVAAEVVEGASEEGHEAAEIVTYSEAKMLNAHMVAGLSIQSTVLDPESNAIAIVAGAMGRGSIRYEGPRFRFPPVVEHLLTDIPRSAVVSMDDDAICVDPVNLRFRGTEDVVLTLRTVIRIKDMLQGSADKVIMQ